MESKQYQTILSILTRIKRFGNLQIFFKLYIFFIYKIKINSEKLPRFQSLALLNAQY